jgi:hypothetical protein
VLRVVFGCTIATAGEHALLGLGKYLFWRAPCIRIAFGRSLPTGIAFKLPHLVHSNTVEVRISAVWIGWRITLEHSAKTWYNSSSAVSPAHEWTARLVWLYGFAIYFWFLIRHVTIFASDAGRRIQRHISRICNRGSLHRARIISGTYVLLAHCCAL